MKRYRIITSLLWFSALTLVAWTLLQLPVESIATTVANLSLLQWLLFLLLNASVLLLLTQRWRTLVNMQQQPVSISEIFLIRQAVQCISFITPGPQFGGEPFQLYWLWKRCSLPLHKGFLSLALDRFLDLWINFAILLAAAMYLFFNVADAAGTAPWIRIALGLLLPLAGLSVLMWALLRRPGWLSASLHRIASRWSQSPRLARLSQMSAGQWQALQEEWVAAVQQRHPALVEAFGLTLLSWCAILAELWLLLSFVGVQPDLSGFVMILLTIRMAMLLPLPAGIGTIEAGILWTFQSQGLDAASAMGLIALMRLRDVAILLLGLLCLRLVRRLGITAQVDTPPSKSGSPTT